MRGCRRGGVWTTKKKGTERARCLVRDISSDVIVLEKVFVSSDPRIDKPGFVTSELTVRGGPDDCAPDLPDTVRWRSLKRQLWFSVPEDEYFWVWAASWLPLATRVTTGGNAHHPAAAMPSHSAARSATIRVGALVLPLVMVGMTLASTTRKP
jgi:hypothetical protein